MGGLNEGFCGIHKVPAGECFSDHYPDAHREVGWPAWSAQIDDTVGGFIVTTYPHPASEHDRRKDGVPLKCGYVIADCMTLKDAQVIAHLLNREGYVPEEVWENPDKWRWVQVGYLDGSLRSL